MLVDGVSVLGVDGPQVQVQVESRRRYTSPVGRRVRGDCASFAVYVPRPRSRRDIACKLETAIRHATDHPLVVVDLDPVADPPKQLAIGPDGGGNLLEVVVLVLADDRLLAVHAMPLRPKYHDLLPTGEDLDG